MALTASAAVCSTMTGGRAMAASEALRVGLIGCGERGVELLRAFHTSSRVSVVAVADCDDKRLDCARALCALDTHQDWRALLARTDIGAVVIAAPDHWHAPMTLAALDAGKDVYCETPMTLRADDAKAVRDAAARTGRAVWIAGSDAPERGPLTVRKRDGRISRIQGDYAYTPPPVRNHEDWRRSRDTSGGAATDLLYGKLAAIVAEFDLGLPTRVSAAGGIAAQDGREAPDNLTMTCTYPGGLEVVLSAFSQINGDCHRFLSEETGDCTHLSPHLFQLFPHNAETGYRAAVAIDMALEAYRTGKTIYRQSEEHFTEA
ncbi:MAG: hypothetical protein QG656_1194 [Candidatus Hydrogenedentes bacterium]|nr:hypothetical protein [Candidatus Hydrogenedentota bacterium]